MAAATTAMVDAADFSELNRQLTEEDERREQLIKRSREVLKLSKNSIYALHRGEVQKAREMVREAKETAKRDLIPIVEKWPSLRHGAFSGAMEEFAEAVIFAEFLGTARVPTMAELEIVNREEYLGGIMDFTGGWCHAEQQAPSPVGVSLHCLPISHTCRAKSLRRTPSHGA
jgi:predicted translin family RNA/ssDNA-binding protein